MSLEFTVHVDNAWNCYNQSETIGGNRLRTIQTLRPAENSLKNLLLLLTTLVLPEYHAISLNDKFPCHCYFEYDFLLLVMGDNLAYIPTTYN